MPKITTKPAATPKVAGKKVAFVGKFVQYGASGYNAVLGWVRDAGGILVDASKSPPDLLVVGEGRGGKPPGDAAKLQKKFPAVELLNLGQLAALVLPEPEVFLKHLQGPRRDHNYWDTLEAQLHTSQVTLDVSGTNLSKGDLYGGKLDRVNLDRCDLRGADTQFTHFGLLKGVNLDNLNGPNVYLTDLEDCTFRGADLTRAWMFWGNAKNISGCDFTNAKMNAARVERGRLVGCTFVKADMSDVEADQSNFERCDFTNANLSRFHAHKTQFDGSVLTNANLHRADLRETSLKNVDLRGTDLREAALGGADLSGANVAGADFAGAILTGATLKGVDFTKAKNYTAPIVRSPGPNSKEFANALAGSKKFETTAEIDIGKGEHANLSFHGGNHSGRAWLRAVSRYIRDGKDSHDWITAPTIERGLLNMADRWPNATLRLDTIKASGSSTVRGQKLRELAVAAWAEAFGKQLAVEVLAAEKEKQKNAATQQRDELMKRIQAKDASAWNAIPYQQKDRYDLRGIDLSGAKLAKLEMRRADLTGSNFATSNLTGAQMWASTLHTVDFSGANLSGADLQFSKCEKALFVSANLKNANLSSTKLHGADFTGADLTGTDLEKAQFDEYTKFPVGFKLPENMVWKGNGSRPGVRTPKATKSGSVDFSSFFAGLSKKVETARVQKATAMLKAERFQLYADVSDDSLVGVVKSQSSKELVYSCRLTSEGRFGCGTHNLKPCGGLQGAICKHILVLVVGLAKAGKLDAAIADNWIVASKSHKPNLDKDTTTATFLKYTGAEAGTLDWRPTETIPEDFYAM